MLRRYTFLPSVALVAFSLATMAADVEQATSMSEVVKGLHEQEKANRPAQRPLSEMSDEEVVAHAAEKARDTVVKIGIGALSAIERMQKKAVAATANAIRNNAARQQTSETPTVADAELPSYGTDNPADSGSAMMPNGEASRAVGETTTAADNVDEQMVVFVLLGLVVAAVLYGVAYMRVQSGNMVVYSSWGDFAASAAWVVLLLIGVGCRYAAEDSGDSLMTAGTVLLWCGGLSAVWMVGGAFQNRSVIDVFFALPARVIVAVLVLFAWSKLKESLDGMRDRRKGIVDGVLIPLGIALFVFNALVKPMVGDNRC